jgi:F-type H+-transporting ATPase subunit epsilon
LKTFVFHLQSATQYERIDGVASFVGLDASGSFGILAGHERMLTTLAFGLARYRTPNRAWQFVAVPGGVLYFADDALYLSTRRYLRGEDAGAMTVALHEQLLAEEAALRDVKQTMARLENEMLRHLQRLGHTREINQ